MAYGSSTSGGSGGSSGGSGGTSGGVSGRGSGRSRTSNVRRVKVPTNKSPRDIKRDNLRGKRNKSALFKANKEQRRLDRELRQKQSALNDTPTNFLPPKPESIPDPPGDFYNPRIDPLSLDIASRRINKKFGKPEDYIELHIYDKSGNLITSNNNFRNYTLNNPDHEGLSFDINFNPESILSQMGYYTGKYVLNFNIQRKLFENSQRPVFEILEISPSRTELKIGHIDKRRDAISVNPPNENDRSEYDTNRRNTISTQLRSYILRRDRSPLLKDFILHFGNDSHIVGTNMQLDTFRGFELFIKLLEPLPADIEEFSEFRIAEDLTDPIEIEVDLGVANSRAREGNFNDDSVPLQGPNFKIDVRLNNSVPSSFKNYNDILTYGVTSSYQNLINKLENREVPEIPYDYIRPVSESSLGEPIETVYHFENFVHFGSALERVKNFRYKLELLELYNSQIQDINSITGNTANTSVVLQSKNDLTDKQTNLLKGLDGYERFLYYTTGSNIYTWPKRNPQGDLYSITSSKAQKWIGSEVDTKPNYGGQLLSASLFDNQNDYSLTRLIPLHILDNPDNNQYSLFINMIGQHFDQLWTHIKHITEQRNTHHTRGVSKDLVYFTLKSLGIDTFDQFENSNLIEYILGQSQSGSAYFNNFVSQSALGATTHPQTFITSSKFGSTPKEDITKNVWKRLYHNAPYLLKTKGTERGIRALMSCYGVPSTLLNVKEYGGPTTDRTKFKTFSYDKSGLALHGDSGTEGYFIKTNWSSSLTETKDVSNTWNLNSTDEFDGKFIPSTTKMVTFRIKPIRPSDNQNYHLFSLNGQKTSTGQFQITHKLAPHLILKPYVGADISGSGDANLYGTLSLIMDNTEVTSSLFPAYNGDFWNIFIGIPPSEDKLNGWAELKYPVFGYCQANYRKSTFFEKIDTSTLPTPLKDKIALNGTNHSLTWGNGQLGTYFGGGLVYSRGGANFCYFGGLDNEASGYTVPSSGLSYTVQGSLPTGETSTVIDGYTVGNPGINNLRYSGSLQEVRFYFHQFLTDETLKRQALEPFMYAGNSVSASYDHLILRLPLGSNNIKSSASFHPSKANYADGQNHRQWLPDKGISSSMVIMKWKEEEEVHHLITPDTVGRSMTSEKVRLDEGTIDDNMLSYTVKSETSTLDNQPLDYEDVGVFFSPTNEINEDIIYTLGAFRLDDYIGNPMHQYSSSYDDLSNLSDVYNKKIERRFNYWDYVKTIQQIDHTLFKIIEQFTPAKANLKTGLLIEPHYLERTKFNRERPSIGVGKSMKNNSYQTFEFQIDPEKVFTIKGTGQKFKHGFKHQGDLLADGGDNDGTIYTSSLNFEEEAVTCMNFKKGSITGSDGYRITKGFHPEIEVIDDYILDEPQEAAQAPINPFGGFKKDSNGTHIPGYGTGFFLSQSENYVKRSSRVLLGNILKGRKSRIYHRRLIDGVENDF